MLELPRAHLAPARIVQCLGTMKLTPMRWLRIRPRNKFAWMCRLCIPVH